jgi:hypothetical protein
MVTILPAFLEKLNDDLYLAAGFIKSYLIQTWNDTNRSLQGLPPLPPSDLLYQACDEGDTEKVKFILKDPLLSEEILNYRKPETMQNSFFIACEKGYLDIVKQLADDNRIDVSISNHEGLAPLAIASQGNHAEIVTYILNYLPVSRNDFAYAFSKACRNEAAETIIALLTDWFIKEVSSFKAASIEEIIKTIFAPIPLLSNNNVEINQLVTENKLPTREQVELAQKQAISIIGIRTFALIVFYNDDFYQALETIEPTTTPDTLLSFVKIVSRLPLELQMIICLRLGERTSNIIPTNESKPSFQYWVLYEQKLLEQSQKSIENDPDLNALTNAPQKSMVRNLV